MIKIIIATHGNLAQELLNATELIAGKQSDVYTVKRAADDSLSQMQSKIESLLKTFDNKEGALILTDMMGGTPCNASVPLCTNFNTEVLAGVNLPMVLSAVFANKTAKSVSELADKVLEDGQKSIINVKKLLMSKMK